MITAKDFLEKYWSGKVKPKWHPPKGLFTKDPKTIANVIAENSDNLKQAVARVNFFFNRGGYCNPDSRNYDKALCSKRKKIIKILDELFGKKNK